MIRKTITTMRRTRRVAAAAEKAVIANRMKY
jgi:hypothetical protein